MRAVLLLAPLMLGACEAKIGEAATDAGNNAVSADGKAEDGQLTIDAPGFDLKVKLPETITANAELDQGRQLLFPGAAVSGIHVAAGADAGGGSDGQVELRFTAPAAPADVLNWYQDAARSAQFAVQNVSQEGQDVLVAATAAAGGEPFRVRLSPGSGGGTEGRLILDPKG